MPLNLGPAISQYLHNAYAAGNLDEVVKQYGIDDDTLTRLYGFERSEGGTWRPRQSGFGPRKKQPESAAEETPRAPTPERKGTSDREGADEEERLRQERELADRDRLDRFAADVSGVFAAQPWLEQFISMDDFLAALRDGTPAGQVLANIRQSEEYRRRFPDLDWAHGETEGQYLTDFNAIGETLRDYGFDTTKFGVDDFADIRRHGIGVRELDDRLRQYDRIVNSQWAEHQKDAWAVYLGRELSDEQVFGMFVSDDFAQGLDETYRTELSNNPVDYETLVRRTGEHALRKLKEKARELGTGVISNDALSALVNSDRQAYEQIIGALAQGGGAPLGYQELLRATEFVLLGAAAKGAGLKLGEGGVDKEDLNLLRQAGIDTAAATQAFTDYSQRQHYYEGVTARQFGSAVESGDVLVGQLGAGNSAALDKLDRALELEAAYSRSKTFGASRAGRRRIAETGRLPA